MNFNLFPTANDEANLAEGCADDGPREVLKGSQDDDLHVLLA